MHWYRRRTGWFGHVLELRRARTSVPGLEVAVAADDGGDGDTALRIDIDAAYHTEHERYGGASVDRMTTDAAAGTTLRLIRDQNAQGRCSTVGS
jgi:hypothetical protein